MMNMLSGWQQKTLALMILTLVVWVAAVSIVRPVLTEYMDHTDAIADAKHQLAQYKRIASSTGDLSARLSDLNASDFDQTFLRSAATPTVAVASIQADLKKWILDHGGQVTSSQGRPSAPAGKNLRVPVVITFNGDMQVLEKVLYDIEKTVPYLIVDSLAVKQQRAGEANRDRNPVLNVTLGVSGFVQNVEASANG